MLLFAYMTTVTQYFWHLGKNHDFCFAFEISLLTYQDKWFVSASNYRGTQRRCSVKYLFRRGNSAGWEINCCRRLQLGISHFFKISSRAGWVVQKTRGDWEHTLIHTSYKKHILLRPLDKVIAFVEKPAVYRRSRRFEAGFQEVCAGLAGFMEDW